VTDCIKFIGQSVSVICSHPMPDFSASLLPQTL